MPRRIPYAVANYEKITNGSYHFVDKSRFIHELEAYEIPVFLRPRRFGKSLWCSMLECYYDINRKDRFEEFFGNTDIARDPTPSRGSRLVMRFDFSIVRMDNDLRELEKSFDEVCEVSFTSFLTRYAQYLPDVVLERGEHATTTLTRLLQVVQDSNVPPVMIIIDEYDNFTNQLLTTRQDDLYRDLTTGDSFLRTFYKTIKAGVGQGSVTGAFITGVLPVTMDDLTSGFNIGQIITLKEETLEMMGFTQEEVDTYVDAIFAEHDWDASLRRRVGEELRAHYNGYRFLPDSRTIYNSTICNYYLNDLVIGKGRLPRNTMDVNLKVDINWLRRLGGEATGDLTDRLLTEGGLPADLSQFTSQFNREKFIQPEFFPMSLYFLGLLSFENEYSLRFPNLTVKTLFVEYFNERMNIQVSSGYGDMCQAFLDNHDLPTLFAGYWDRYVGQIPAQAFDKANENFFRTTFYEICNRYLSRHLSFAIEVNRHSGRSDFEALGRPGSNFDNKAWVVEFKHFSVKEAERVGLMEWKEARTEDADQVRGYAVDLERVHPHMKTLCMVFYTAGPKGFRCFELER